MIILKSVAILADHTGKFRYQVQACGENITSIEQGETLVEVKRYKQIGFPYKLEEVDWFEWEKARRGQLNGYVDRPNMDEPVTLVNWG